MLVSLPARMDAHGIDSFMAQMFSADGSLKHSSFVLNFTNLQFIEPCGVVSLANAVEYALVRRCIVNFKGTNTFSEPIKYLDDCGFFKMYAGRYIRPGHGERVTTASLKKVAYAESHAWFENDLGHWLARRFGLPAAALAGVQTCMKEVFNNIDNHSGKTVGCTHMQHFPALNEVVIAVSDFGVGIPTAIRREFPTYVVDHEAIHHASALGVTSKTTLGNAGIGLDTLIKLIVERNGGIVRIHSGHGKLVCKMVRGVASRNPVATAAFYPGTMVEIRLNTNTFMPEEVERESLEW